MGDSELQETPIAFVLLLIWMALGSNTWAHFFEAVFRVQRLSLKFASCDPFIQSIWNSAFPLALFGTYSTTFLFCSRYQPLLVAHDSLLGLVMVTDCSSTLKGDWNNFTALPVSCLWFLKGILLVLGEGIKVIHIPCSIYFVFYKVNSCYEKDRVTPLSCGLNSCQSKGTQEVMNKVQRKRRGWVYFLYSHKPLNPTSVLPLTVCVQEPWAWKNCPFFPSGINDVLPWWPQYFAAFHEGSSGHPSL